MSDEPSPKQQRARGGGRKPEIKETTSEPKLLRSDLTRVEEEMDVLGVRIQRSGGNQFKRFCANNRYNYGEAIIWLMEKARINLDGNKSDSDEF